MKLSRSIKTACELTPEVMEVAARFGIGADREHEIVLYEDLELTPGPGRVILLTGESGAGKTSLLRDIAAGEHGMSVVHVPKPDERPLVNLFEDRSLKDRLGLLNVAGISEVAIWLRKPSELSDGQRYRLSIAMAVWWSAQFKRPLILLDEFLATLDRECAKAVAHQLRKVADQFGIGFVVATTHADLTADLDPDEIVTMRLGLQPCQHGGRGAERAEIKPPAGRRTSKARRGSGGLPTGSEPDAAEGPEEAGQDAAEG